MWVVKIGGSLATDACLADWLQVLAAPHRVPMVIVPGGGAFADCVRLQQARWRFGDRAAHAMALLAMAQFGLMLQGLCPSLVVETRVAALSESRDRRGTRIWLPLDLIGGAEGIEESWDVTSDSLAAWLAREIGADRLLVVKSFALPRAPDIAELATTGVVDRRFEAFVRDAPFDVELIEKNELQRVRALLADG